MHEISSVSMKLRKTQYGEPDDNSSPSTCGKNIAGTIYSPGHTGVLLKLVSLNHPHLSQQTITALLLRILAGDYQTNIKI